jgi:Zn-dependent protease with chaperone function
MNIIYKGLLMLIKSALTGKKLMLPEGFTLEKAERLIGSQSLVPLIYPGAINCEISTKTELMQKYQVQYFRHLVIGDRQVKAVERLCAAFEEHGIDYMLLKGCNLKAMYPKPEMRAMGDADVLIRLDQYDRIRPVMQSLGYKEVKESSYDFVWQIPELYLEQTPAVNAYTQGDSIVSITLTSGLVEAMTDLQIRAVLAHEVAHVACHHVLYHTLGDLLLTAGSDLLGLGGLLTAPLRLPLYQWLRMSELSCDRAAALCLGDPQPMLEALMILAGGKESRFGPLNLESYIRQAETYAKETDESLLSKGLQYISVVGQTHPFLSMRVSELLAFSRSDRYKQLMKRYEMAHTPISVPHMG